MHRRDLPIVRACDQTWDDLDGDTRTRHCRTCDHAVINLSAMTAAEARSVIERARTTRVCVRYRATTDGEVMFAFGPSPGAPSYDLRPLALGLSLLAAAPLLAACTPEPQILASPKDPVPTSPRRLPPLTIKPPVKAETPCAPKDPRARHHEDDLMGLLTPVF
jgi:hypothetical protein